MINQTDLRYFLELAQTLHLTRAAERIGITQPALSHCLKRIETDLNTQLFIRSKKGVELTSAGIKLKQSATELIQNWETLRFAIQADTEEIQGVIKLGCHTAVAQYLLPKVLSELLKENPRIDLQLTHGLSRHMTEQVVSSALDVAVAVNPVPNPDLIIKELCKDEVCLWQANNLKNPEVLILEPGLLQTQDILRKLRKSGITFNRIIESASLEVIASFVAQGMGCGILPERVLQTHERGKYEKVKGTPHFIDKICLVYKKEFRQLKRGQVFIKKMQEFAN
ncbi:MAG: LysR family transcriptional regulator [Bdellovibrionota bacterium]